MFNNKIENMLEARIIEPLKIKSQAISSASEVANMILRIDDVIASTGKQHGGIGLGEPKKNQGMYDEF